MRSNQANSFKNLSSYHIILKKLSMKKSTLLTVMFMLITCFIEAQDSNYKVVFDMTSKDTVNQQTLIRQLGLVRKANPNAKMEVVIYGQGLDLAVKGKTNQETAINQLLADKGISFKVCAITMERNNVDKTQLISGVIIVPDGIYEIVSKQQEGWGYIKIAH
jgi:intracellular sulfur oxidation DsrE/DsrF family protein